MMQHNKPARARALSARGRTRKLVTWSAALLAFCAAGPLRAHVFVVTNAASSGPGSLLQAVLASESAPGADNIEFEGAFFNSAREIRLEDELRLTQELSISGPGRSLLTVIGTPGSGIGTFVLDRLPSASPPTLTVAGLTLRTEAVAGSHRRQFFVRGANLALRDVRLQGSGQELPGASGGAIVVQNGNLGMIDCEVRNFVTRHRGAAVFVLEDDLATGNRVFIENCVLRDNRVAGPNESDGFPKDGGALFVQGDHAMAPGTKVYVAMSELSGNSALNGGAIAIRNAVALTVLNSTLSDNAAAESGGAVYIFKSPQAAIYDPPVYIEASTVTANRARFGGGLVMESPATRGLLLANSVIAGNTATLAGQSVPNSADVFKRGEIVAAYSLIGDDVNDAQGLIIVEHQSAIGSVMRDTNPRLGPLAANGGSSRTHALLSGSPLIDAGRAAAAPRDTDLGFPGNDQRGTGFARARGSSVDIGAFESTPAGGGGGGGSGSGGGGGGAAGFTWLCGAFAALLARGRRRVKA